MELDTAPPTGSWLVLPRLVFQLIAPGTGGTMPGCSPRSRLPARGFCPNHFPGPKRRSQEPATAPLGTRGDNGGLLITPSLPFLLNINPLKQFCWQEPRPRGGEERGARPRASQGARRDGVTSPSPTRTIHSEAPPMPDPRGVCGPAAPLHAPSSHLLQIRGVSCYVFGLVSPPLGGSCVLTRLHVPTIHLHHCLH